MIVFSPQNPKTRSRCSPTSTAATAASSTPDRRVQQARHPRALHVAIRARARHRVLAQGRIGVVRGRPQGRAHAREAWRGRSRARTAATPSSRRSTSSATTSASTARRDLHCRTATTSAATCRRRSSCRRSRKRRRQRRPRRADVQRSSSAQLVLASPSHSLASSGGGFFSVITGHFFASSALSAEFSWPAGHLLLGEDRLDRALRLAQRAVDALLGIDDQDVRAFVEAVHRAHLDAVHVLALDAVFGDDEGHLSSAKSRSHRVERARAAARILPKHGRPARTGSASGAARAGRSS